MWRLGLWLALTLATLVGCVTSAPQPPPPVDPARALAMEPLAMPVAPERPLLRQPDGSFLTEPVSARIEPGVPYAYEVMTHCGFTAVSWDVDGSFWMLHGPLDDGRGNPPRGVGNPTDAGVFLLVDPERALWVSGVGMRFELSRAAPGPQAVFPCD